MKNKLYNILIMFGLAGVATVIVLLAAEAGTIKTLWVQYVLLLSVLLVCLCLNLKFFRYSDFDEAVGCLRRAKRAVAKITPGKDVALVKIGSIRNQIANSLIYLEDLITKYDLYGLKELARKTENFSARLRIEEFRLNLTAAEIKNGVGLLDDALIAVKKFRTDHIEKLR